MSRAELLRFSVQALAAWLVLSSLCIYFGAALGDLMLPLFAFVIRLVAPQYSPSLALVADHHDFLIRLEAWVLHPLPLGGGRAVPEGQSLTTGTHVLHTLVPAVIEGSIVLAWPTRRWRERAVLLGLGLASSVFIIAVTGPFVLLGQLEVVIQQMAEQAHLARREPAILTWMIFNEVGGRWVLALIAAVLCILVTHRCLGDTWRSAG